MILLEERGRRPEALADGEAAVQLSVVVPQHVQARADDVAEHVVIVETHRAVDFQAVIPESPVGLQEQPRRAVDIIVDAVVVVAGVVGSRAAQILVAIVETCGQQGFAQRLPDADLEVVLVLIGLVDRLLIKGILLVVGVAAGCRRRAFWCRWL